MESDTVLTPAEAIVKFLGSRASALIFEYDNDYKEVVKRDLPAKLGMDSVSADDLYRGLDGIVRIGVIQEQFDEIKYRAGINDSVGQPRVIYRLRG